MDVVDGMISGSVLQCVAVFCSVLQCVAACCSANLWISWMLYVARSQGPAICCVTHTNASCVAECCSVLQGVAAWCCKMWCVAVCCRLVPCCTVSHIWMHQVPNKILNHTLNPSLFTLNPRLWVVRGLPCECVTSHIWMRHVTRMDASCHTYERVMSRVSMCRVIHVSISWHAYNYVMP